MKANNKGFTLIELLAIIVILAIIAVITVPVILNIIDDARNGADKNSVIGYGKAVELAYTQYLYEESLGSDNSHVASSSEASQSVTNQDGKVISITIDGGSTPVNLKIDFEGANVVCGGNNTITSGKVSLNSCTVDGGSKTYSYSDGAVE